MAKFSSARLIGLSGSIRRQSFCTAVLRAVANQLDRSGKANLQLFALADVPLYNGDLEGDRAPSQVCALRDAVADCDGVILCSPEYNYGMSGVLKNALDWISRPAFASPMKGLPALIMTASPAWTGGVRAQQQLRDTLLSMLARPVATPEIVIGDVHRKIVGGELVDEANLAFIDAAVEQLIAEIEMLKAGPRA